MAHAVAPSITRVADAAAFTSLHSVCGCFRFLWWMSRTGPRTKWAESTIPRREPILVGVDQSHPIISSVARPPHAVRRRLKVARAVRRLALVERALAALRRDKMSSFGERLERVGPSFRFDLGRDLRPGPRRPRKRLHVFAFNVRLDGQANGRCVVYSRGPLGSCRLEIFYFYSCPCRARVDAARSRSKKAKAARPRS